MVIVKEKLSIFVISSRRSAELSTSMMRFMDDYLQSALLAVHSFYLMLEIKSLFRVKNISVHSVVLFKCIFWIKADFLPEF